MTSLVDAFKQHITDMDNRTVSDKGDAAYVSTLKPLIDLYSSMGALRGNEDEFLNYLNPAFNEDPVKTLALLFKLRDIRSGMGERDLFRAGIAYLENRVDFSKFIPLIVKYGRFDDLYFLRSKESIRAVADYFVSIIKPEVETEEVIFNRGLLAKWLPRKPRNSTERYLHTLLRSKLKMSPAELRHWMVQHSNTVEQLMCNKRWDEINYSQVPSQAINKYKKGFKRNDEERYTAYLNELSKPKEERDLLVKVNAGAIYPYQIMNNDLWESDEINLANAQWEALPDFLNGSKTRILPMIDVSGSMELEIKGSSVTCMDVAISLGAYLTQRNEGSLKGTYLTFSENPTIDTINGITNVKDIYRKIKGSDWGMNTDLSKAIDSILTLRDKYNLARDQLPEIIVILSDMSFDTATSRDTRMTSFFGNRNFDNTWQTKYMEIREKYALRGLTPPKIIYWNLNHNGTFTCTVNDIDVCEISGFSPAIFKDVLSTLNEITPESVFNKSIESYLEDINSVLGGDDLEVTERKLSYPGIAKVDQELIAKVLLSNLMPNGGEFAVSSEAIEDYLKNKDRKEIKFKISSINF